MKRYLPVKKLRLLGCYIKREVKSHSPWINPKTGHMEAVPRHSNIKEPLAIKILKQMEERETKP
jgi:mRNA interferase HicA